MEKTNEAEKKKWQGMTNEIKTGQDKIMGEIAAIEKSSWQAFREWMVKKWNGNVPVKIVLLILVSILAEYIIGQFPTIPEWVETLVFYGLWGIALFIGEGAGALMDFIQDLINLRMGLKGVKMTMDEVESCMDLFSSVLENEPADTREKFEAMVIKLKDAVINGKSALDLVIDKLAEKYDNVPKS